MFKKAAFLPCFILEKSWAGIARSAWSYVIVIHDTNLSCLCNWSYYVWELARGCAFTDDIAETITCRGYFGILSETLREEIYRVFRFIFKQLSFLSPIPTPENAARILLAFDDKLDWIDIVLM